MSCPENDILKINQCNFDFYFHDRKWYQELWHVILTAFITCLKKCLVKSLTQLWKNSLLLFCEYCVYSVYLCLVRCMIYTHFLLSAFLFTLLIMCFVNFDFKILTLQRQFRSSGTDNSTLAKQKKHTGYSCSYFVQITGTWLYIFYPSSSVKCKYQHQICNTFVKHSVISKSTAAYLPGSPLCFKLPTTS